MFEYPGFDPILLRLGPLAVRWYGLMYLIGIALGWWLLRRRAKRGVIDWQPAQVDDMVFYTAMGVILGGRIGYTFFYGWANLVADPLSILRIWEGGMSFHGGLLGVMVAMWWFGRAHGRDMFSMCDVIAPVVPIGLGAGRLGNFINGELWGAPTELPWAVIVDGVPRHASQLYEATLEGLILFTILWIYSSKPRPAWAVAGLFGGLYGVFRFSIEFVRLPDAHIGYLAGGWLTMGMLLSAPMIVIGAGMVARAYLRPAASRV
jgi:phosphatidylglycerol---prolipoprotein diacylglyceryl transferase